MILILAVILTIVCSFILGMEYKRRNHECAYSLVYKETPYSEMKVGEVGYVPYWFLDSNGNILSDDRIVFNKKIGTFDTKIVKK